MYIYDNFQYYCVLETINGNGDLFYFHSSYWWMIAMLRLTLHGCFYFGLLLWTLKKKLIELIKSKTFKQLTIFFFPNLFRRWLQPWVGWHHLLASQPTWSAGLSQVSWLCPRLQPQRCKKTPSHNRIRSRRRWIWAEGTQTVWCGSCTMQTCQWV